MRFCFPAFMSLVCGIDLGSFRTPSYVAWMEDGEIVLDTYVASVEEPLPPPPGGFPAAFTAIDGPQGLPVPGQRTRRCDREAGVPTKSLPTDRAELAMWPLYRPFLTAGVELFWSVYEQERASVLGLVLIPDTGVVCVRAAGYTCVGDISRPDHVDAMLCALAAEACLLADDLPGGTVGDPPVADPAERVLREGFLVAPES